MRGWYRSIAALAVLAAAVPAAAFYRETTVPGSPGNGVCLWWGSRSVGYEINATAAALSACGTEAAAVGEARAGLDTWGVEASSCTDFGFDYLGTTARTAMGTGANLVVFRAGPCGAGALYPNNCWSHGIGTIGLTTTSFDSHTGEIHRADMELFAWDGVAPDPSNPDAHGYYFSCGGPGLPACGFFSSSSCNDTDVQAVVTHEGGHMLGLDHVCMYDPVYNQCNKDSSIKPIMSPDVGRVDQRGLRTDDISGICTIYPKGGPTLTCAPPNGNKSGGCGSTGAPGAGGLLVAAFAFLRRRLRAS
jgi:uncharacterized protein (TIGR03382 family)